MSRSLIPFVFAALAALWAALLALAEGALAVNPQLGTLHLPRLFSEKPERLRRGLSIGRIGLLTLAALGLSGAVQWWAEEPAAAAGWLVLLVAITVLSADLLPRLVGLWRSRSLGPWVVRVAAASLGAIAPVFIAAGILDRAFARLFGVPAPRGQGTEIAQREMLLGVFALAETMVSEVMTPRVAIVGVDVRQSFEEVLRQATAASFARLPVFDDDLDHIVGVLYAKDLLETRFGAPGPGHWQGLVRPVEIIPEVKTLDRQLRDFQRGPSHLAVVVDEFGGTAGIVTLEDVLEEIVGEIADEYDEAQGPAVVETAPGVFEVDGRAPLDALAEALGTPLDHEEVSTAGGWVYAELGHVPAPGESVTAAGWRITVVRVEKRSIARLRFVRAAPAAEASA